MQTLQQALKDARAGKPVDTSSLPQVMALPLAGGNSANSSGTPSKEASPSHAAAAAPAPPMQSIASAAATRPSQPQSPVVQPKPKLSNAGTGLTPVEESEAPAAPPVPARATSTSSAFDAKGYASRGQKLVLNFVSGATEEARERALAEKLAQLPPDRRALLENLGERREQFAEAARQAQAASEAPSARKYLGTVKQFEAVMKAVFAGQAIDLSLMPPPPPGFPDVGHVPALTSKPAAAPSRPRPRSRSSRQQPTPTRVLTRLRSIPKSPPHSLASQTSPNSPKNVRAPSLKQNLRLDVICHESSSQVSLQLLL